MDKQKLKLVTTNVFHRLGYYVLITVGVVVGLQVLLAVCDLVVKHNLESFWLDLAGIPGSLAGFINLALVIYFIVDSYTDFKWSIQNGISRRTMWTGRLLALVLSTLVIFALDELLSMTSQPAMGGRTLLVNFAILLTIVLTCQAIGNGFGLLSRRWKWVVGIGLPIVLISLFVAFIKMLLEVLGPQAGFLLAHQQFIRVLAGLFNSPATLWVLWAVYLAIILLLTWVFNNRLQLRRD